MSQTTLQILSHTVQQGDQIERLALKYMGDASLWVQIAILNGLSYPFLTDDDTFVREVRATGTVTFSRAAGSTGAVTILGGARVFAPATANAPVRFYTTDALAVILDGQATVDAPVTAVTSGDLGNTAALSITGLAFMVLNLDAVTNRGAVTGGEIFNVKFPGDTLLVYASATGSAATVGVDTHSLKDGAFYEGLMGADLALDRSGDLFGDLRGGMAVGAGIANLRDSLRRRLQTDLGWYAYSPAYGTLIEQAVGEPGTAARLQAVSVDVERTLRGDPRVADVQGVTAVFQQGVLAITARIIVIGETTPQNLVLQLPGR